MSKEIVTCIYSILGNQFDEDPKTCQKLYPPKVFPFSFETPEQVLLRDVLKNACGFHFFDIGDLKKEFPFQVKGQFTVFAQDNQNGCYGFIGGIGGLGEEDVFSIGYVSATKEAAKVADSMKELLSLILYYPNWHDIIIHKASEPAYYCDMMELKQRLEEIDRIYDIPLAADAIEILKARLDAQPQFQVFYPSEKII